jgi:hypothetical protein
MKRNKLKFSQRPTFHLASSLANFNLPPRFLPQQKKEEKPNTQTSMLPISTYYQNRRGKTMKNQNQAGCEQKQNNNF